MMLHRKTRQRCSARPMQWLCYGGTDLFQTWEDRFVGPSMRTRKKRSAGGREEGSKRGRGDLGEIASFR